VISDNLNRNKNRNKKTVSEYHKKVCSRRTINKAKRLIVLFAEKIVIRLDADSGLNRQCNVCEDVGWMDENCSVQQKLISFINNINKKFVCP